MYAAWKIDVSSIIIYLFVYIRYLNSWGEYVQLYFCYVCLFSIVRFPLRIRKLAKYFRIRCEGCALLSRPRVRYCSRTPSPTPSHNPARAITWHRRNYKRITCKSIGYAPVVSQANITRYFFGGPPLARESDIRVTGAAGALLLHCAGIPPATPAPAAVQESWQTATTRRPPPSSFAETITRCLRAPFRYRNAFSKPVSRWTQLTEGDIHHRTSCRESTEVENFRPL